MTLRVSYLINQYPKVSHSFIRREILALERLGVTVERIAVRGWDAAIVDDEDKLEQRATRYLLSDGLSGLVVPTLAMLASRPGPFVKALGTALSLARRADRPLVFHLIYLMQACRLVAWLHESRADHLHAHFGTNPAEVAVLARVLGGPPCSFTVHGPEEFDRPQALHLARKASLSAFVVAISSFGRSQLFRWLPSTSWGKVRVVHCGLEPSFRAGASSAPSVSPRLVCVGRLCEQKGQLLLLEAAGRLHQQGIDFELVFAGDGEMRAEVEQTIARLGLRAKVRVTGWISSGQVRDELLASRALVLPSFAEGLPVVIMEALSLGRPVISTYVAGIPELVEHGISGWLCPAGDVDSLAAAMKECLEAPFDRLVDMGRRGRTRVIERHNVDQEAGKLLSLFQASSRVDAVLA